MEKEAIKEMVGNLVISVLWQADVKEASGDTELHHIDVWKEGDSVKVVIRKVR